MGPLVASRAKLFKPMQQLGLLFGYEALQMYLTGHAELMRVFGAVAISAAVLLVLSSIFARPRRGPWR